MCEKEPNAPSRYLVSKWYIKGVGHALSCFYAGIDSDKYVRRYGSAETRALSLPRHKNQEMHT